MSEINKIVAAILTGARLTRKDDMSLDDYTVGYFSTLKQLNDAEAKEDKASGDAWGKSMISALEDINKGPA